VEGVNLVEKGDKISGFTITKLWSYDVESYIDYRHEMVVINHLQPYSS